MSEPKPSLVSIIVPVFNGGAVFRECLRKLLTSNYPALEIIISDDGSTDGSAQWAQSEGVIVLRSPRRQGAANARNAAAEVARGEILFFTDSDVWVEPDTISRLAELLNTDPTLDAVMGSYTNSVPHKDIWTRFKNLHHHYIHQISKREAVTFWTGCGMVRKEAFWSVGGFDTSYQGATIEDIELGYRLTRSGRRILLIREVQVTHAKHYNLRSLMRSDIFHRAIPWTTLMLRDKTFRSDLNTTPSNALSVIFSWLILVSPVFMVFFSFYALIATAMLLTLFIILNLHFYKYVKRYEGISFTLAMIPMTWFYFLYSGLGLFLGICVFFKSRVAKRR